MAKLAVRLQRNIIAAVCAAAADDAKKGATAAQLRALLPHRQPGWLRAVSLRRDGRYQTAHLVGLRILSEDRWIDRSIHRSVDRSLDTTCSFAMTVADRRMHSVVLFAVCRTACGSVSGDAFLLRYLWGALTNGGYWNKAERPNPLAYSALRVHW